MNTSDKYNQDVVREETKKAIITSLAQSCTVTVACQAANITRQTYYAWLKDDPNFRLAVSRSELSAVQSVEDALWNNAMGGDTQAQKFFLTNRAGHRWKNMKAVEISGGLQLNANDFMQDINAMREVTRNEQAANGTVDTNS